MDLQIDLVVKAYPGGQFVDDAWLDAATARGEDLDPGATQKYYHKKQVRILHHNPNN